MQIPSSSSQRAQDSVNCFLRSYFTSDAGSRLEPGFLSFLPRLLPSGHYRQLEGHKACFFLVNAGLPFAVVANLKLEVLLRYEPIAGMVVGDLDALTVKVRAAAILEQLWALVPPWVLAPHWQRRAKVVGARRIERARARSQASWTPAIQTLALQVSAPISMNVVGRRHRCGLINLPSTTPSNALRLMQGSLKPAVSAEKTPRPRKPLCCAKAALPVNVDVGDVGACCASEERQAGPPLDGKVGVPALEQRPDPGVLRTHALRPHRRMSINISLRDLDLAELRPWLRPLDRAVIRTGMKQTIDFFHRRVPDLDDPRWLTVERQNLYDVEHVIQLEVAECNLNEKNWIANDKLVVQLYEERFVRLGFNGSPEKESEGEDEGSEGGQPGGGSIVGDGAERQRQARAVFPSTFRETTRIDDIAVFK
ncbi:hypothetical protein MIND_01117500 [Mycena indigotica]|uniref:Uncharacterized protein n=1 Tax=Mycena indigotica TaxID=2126181 RepID=A0A8H6S5D5_9AGAR|nr:uncharacterized protein MIND_01117500 [Mycena indigotica]KAF7293405.1 hypothetical protein MIND_01117500 [Mycena indigotica]